MSASLNYLVFNNPETALRSIKRKHGFVPMKKIAFTVPIDVCEQVKDSMYRAGAGRFNNYERQCWQTLGEGQWLPLKGANPAIGKEGVLEKVQEFKVEMFCEDEYLDSAINAMLTTHPYEGPQFEVYSIENRIVIKHA